MVESNFLSNRQMDQSCLWVEMTTCDITIVSILKMLVMAIMAY